MLGTESGGDDTSPIAKLFPPVVLRYAIAGPVKR